VRWRNIGMKKENQLVDEANVMKFLLGQFIFFIEYKDMEKHGMKLIYEDDEFL
jgi:hypothetical protein